MSIWNKTLRKESVCELVTCSGCRFCSYDCLFYTANRLQHEIIVRNLKRNMSESHRRGKRGKRDHAMRSNGLGSNSREIPSFLVCADTSLRRICFLPTYGSLSSVISILLTKLFDHFSSRCSGKARILSSVKGDYLNFPTIAAYHTSILSLQNLKFFDGIVLHLQVLTSSLLH